MLDDQPRNAREVYHRVAANGRRYEGNVPAKVVRVVLGRLADVGQVVRERNDDDEARGALLARWRASTPAPTA